MQLIVIWAAVCPFKLNTWQILRHKKSWSNLEVYKSDACFLMRKPFCFGKSLNAARFIFFLNAAPTLSAFIVETPLPMTLCAPSSAVMLADGFLGTRVSPSPSASPIFPPSQVSQELPRLVSVWQQLSAGRTEQCWYEFFVEVMTICVERQWGRFRPAVAARLLPAFSDSDERM